MADELDLAEIGRILEGHRRDLQEKIDALATPPERGALLGFGKRIGDGTTEAITRMTEAGVGGSLELQLERVNRALAKIGDGSYGQCDSCGAAIAPARLHAAPESVLCIDCASNR